MRGSLSHGTGSGNLPQAITLFLIEKVTITGDRSITGLTPEKGEILKADVASQGLKRNPPFLILHGTKDATVPIEQSKILGAALTKAGVEHQFVILEGAEHAFDLQPSQRDLRPLVIGFFDRYLKKQ